MTMIERVAQQIGWSLGEGGAGTWRKYERAARYAIAAMREPSAEMSATGERLLRESALPVWHAMIDAALNEALEQSR
jgi:hypothetical protein